MRRSGWLLFWIVVVVWTTVRWHGRRGAANHAVRESPVVRRSAQIPSTINGENLVQTQRTREATGPKPSGSAGLKRPNPAVVTMANSRFYRCSLDLVATVRDQGQWNHAVLVIVPPGKRFTAVELAHFKKHDRPGSPVQLVNASFTLEDQLQNFGAGPSLQYSKLTLFTDPLFRAYDTIIYIDADSQVKSPLNVLLELALQLDPSKHILLCV